MILHAYQKMRNIEFELITSSNVQPCVSIVETHHQVSGLLSISVDFDGIFDYSQLSFISSGRSIIFRHSKKPFAI